MFHVVGCYPICSESLIDYFFPSVSYPLFIDLVSLYDLLTSQYPYQVGCFGDGDLEKSECGPVFLHGLRVSVSVISCVCALGRERQADPSIIPKVMLGQNPGSWGHICCARDHMRVLGCVSHLDNICSISSSTLQIQHNCLSSAPCMCLHVDPRR
jgi:hypothetical protein